MDCLPFFKFGSHFLSVGLNREREVWFAQLLYEYDTQQDMQEALWRADGTREGTFSIVDVNPYSWEATNIRMAALGDTLYFNADVGDFGNELWKTDGTREGTLLVADVNSGTHHGRAFSKIIGLTPAEDSLFFIADDGVHGRELWRLVP